jgi:hemerythrin-like domain-containing protein
MIDIIQGLRQEHRNIESLLGVLERELSVFDRGERPDYDVVLAVIDYFKDLSGFLPSPEGGHDR